MNSLAWSCHGHCSSPFSPASSRQPTLVIGSTGRHCRSTVHRTGSRRWSTLTFHLDATHVGWEELSLHGKVASPFKVAYISAKHGVLGLTKVVALETAEHNITCNAICPAYVRTPLVEKQIADQAKANGISEEDVVQKIMLAPAAIKRLLEPSEVASLVKYLCTDEAAGITGAALDIDLGWTAR